MTDIGRQIIELRKQGMPVKQIAKALNCSKSTASKWCSVLRENHDITSANSPQQDDATTINNRRKAKELQLLASIGPCDNVNARYNKMRRFTSKQYLMSPANNACQLCSYNKCVNNLSFHHVDELSKSYQLSGTKMIASSISKLVVEASKCALVCANCHGEIHAGLVVAPSTLKYENVPDSAIEWYFRTTGFTKPQFDWSIKDE